MTIADIAPSASGTDAAAPLYRAQGVTRTYTQKGRTVKALTGVDLTILPGEFVTIQGPTGGGKSTLLQMLGALDKPSSGSLKLGDIELASASARELSRIRAQEIGFVFQGFNLIPTLTAAENVDMALEPTDLSRTERTARVAEALAHVGLADRGDHLPTELSGGQQQRVAIARAIVKRPRVLLADEPTGNLDESMRDEILTLLQGLCAEGITMIVVTHDSAVALVEVLMEEGAADSVEEAATRLAVSLRTLQRLAHRHVGVSPAAMIRRRRLQEAAEHLRLHPSVDLADLAADLGYADHAHLTRDFRNVLGIAPRAYRASSAQDVRSAAAPP